jgi:hypothetical protein
MTMMIMMMGVMRIWIDESPRSVPLEEYSCACLADGIVGNGMEDIAYTCPLEEWGAYLPYGTPLG